MQRTLLPAAVVALTLAATPAAVAKEITKAEVCGAGGCTSVDDADGRFALMEGGRPRNPPPAAPYYEVNMEMDQGGEFSYTAVPDRRAYRADDGAWYEMGPAMVVLVAKVTAREQAFPAAGLIGAAPAPEPRRAAADAGSPLWPEGVLVAIVLAIGGGFLVRAARASGRVRAASG
jgi:hypothetical protein